MQAERSRDHSWKSSLNNQLWLRCLLVFAFWLPNSRPLHSQADTAPVNATESVDFELRIVWGGPIRRQFDGTVSIDSGSIDVIRQLSLQPDSATSYKSVSQQEIRCEPHSASTFGGLDLRVRGSLESRLHLEFLDPATGKSSEHNIALSEVINSSWSNGLDDAGTRVAAERQFHDKIRIDSKRSNLVFQTAEAWSPRIEGYRTGLVPGAYVLKTQFTSATSGTIPAQELIVEVDEAGNFMGQTIELQVPQNEGAWLLECSLHRRRFMSSILSSKADLTRRLDLVVVDDSPLDSQFAWNPQISINALEASEPGRLAWLAPSIKTVSTTLGSFGQWQRYNPLAYVTDTSRSHGKLGSRKISIPNSDTQEDALTLEPNSWLAIPLTGLTRGATHRLRVTAPSDTAMQLAVSCRQTDANGEFLPFTADVVLDIDERETTPRGLTSQDLLFWPSGPQEFILLANPHPQRVASVLRLEVDVATVSQSEAAEAPNRTSRSTGIYFDRPAITDCFTADRVADLVTGQRLDSWHTWLQTSQRLEQQMSWLDTNLVTLKIATDGGAIYPSTELSPSTRFDTGTFYADGRSPEIKDVVELMLRQLDRTRSKKAVLELTLNQPLPKVNLPNPSRDIWQLELADSGNSADSDNIADGAGKKPSQQRSNPLHSSFQAAVVGVVREVINRYGHHPSFTGISIELDQQSQLLFAGDNWGYNPELISQFEQAMQARLPAGDDLALRLQGANRLAFLNWRAQQLTQLFARLAQEVQRGEPTRKLYLNPTGLWKDYPSDVGFTNPDAALRNPRDFLTAMGLDVESLSRVEGLEIVGGVINGHRESVDTNEWILQLASEKGIAGEQQRSAAEIQLNKALHLDGLEKLASVSAHPSSEWIHPFYSRHSQYARKTVVENFLRNDLQTQSIGGWQAPAGSVDVLQTLHRTIRQFPPIVLSDYPLRQSDSNIRLRFGTFEGKSYLQLVNAAPWSERVEITMSARLSESLLEILGQPDKRVTVSGNQILLEVPAYDLVGIAITDPTLTIREFWHSSDDETQMRIAQELQNLELLVAQSGDPTQQQRLANIFGSFENWTKDGTPANWNVSSLPGVFVSQSNDLPHSGNSALLIENRNEGNSPAWVQSYPIPAPTTGRMAIQAWFRVSAAGGATTVRLSIRGRLENGKRFERFEVLSNSGNSQQSISNDWGRQPAVLNVRDLPSDEVEELVIAIDLLGPGRLWVDDVEVFESQLHPDERKYLQGILLVAKQQLEKNNLYPAEKLLDGHWGQYLVSANQSDEQSRIADRSANPTNGYNIQDAPPKQRPILQQWRESIRDKWRR